MRVIVYVVEVYGSKTICKLDAEITFEVIPGGVRDYRLHDLNNGCRHS